jgi:hypothetical protein
MNASSADSVLEEIGLALLYEPPAGWIEGGQAAMMPIVLQ